MLKDIKHTLLAGYYRHFAGFMMSSRNFTKIYCSLFVLTLIIKAILTLSGSEIYYHKFLINTYQSLDVDVAKYHPWTLFTFNFLVLSLGDVVFWGSILYTFGQLLDHFYGPGRFFLIYVSSSFFVALALLIASNKINLSIEYLSGPYISISSLIGSMGYFAPNYGLRYFIFGEVKLKYVCIFFLCYSIYLYSFDRMESLMIISGLAYGYCYMFLLSKGYDISRPFRYVFDKLRR